MAHELRFVGKTGSQDPIKERPEDIWTFQCKDCHEIVTSTYCEDVWCPNAPVVSCKEKNCINRVRQAFVDIGFCDEHMF